jgi:KUP system potassium uptake protein
MKAQRIDRRRIDQSASPPGAATEAAIAGEAELEGIGAALPEPADEGVAEAHTPRALLALAVGAAGVVYGDIATSPLYSLQFAFHGALPATAVNVFGAASLVVWALVLVVSVKYVGFMMRADNRGEGGILALLTLLLPDLNRGRSAHRALWVGAGLLGAALLFGDGAIAPAISVLSAVEGLEVASPQLHAFVVPLTVAILGALFAFQRQGTARVGRVFGPLMLLWFVVVGTMGAVEVARHPAILAALSPVHAVRFFVANGWHGMLVLGAVILAITGCEALYADMGHFGRAPIRLVWFGIALPSLVLNYLAQGSMLLRTTGTGAHPFFELAPHALLYPIVLLATVATVIASQSLISGVFSLTRQLMHLGFCPIMTVRHTSPEREGQIYIPIVNALLFAVCLLLVIGFRSSDRLAAAFGLALAGTMAFTTLLFYLVTRWCWAWPRAVAFPVAAVFLTIDLSFVVTNATKFRAGGWLPLAIASAVLVLFATWHRGRARLLAVRARLSEPLEAMIERVQRQGLCRTPGTGIFLSADEDVAPSILRHYVERVRSLHAQVILVTVRAAASPRVPRAERLEVTRFPAGFVSVVARYGYMQSVALSEVLAECEARGVCDAPETPTYYLPRERLVPTGRTRMARWRKSIFIFLHRNAPTMQDFFALPNAQVLDLGLPVEL